MAGIKNKYDFYKGFLEALGAEGINETDYKNEEELRKKILDALDVEYVFDDVNQTDLFREKFLQGISSGGGGGGSSDFSTAQVTFIFSEQKPNINRPRTVYIDPEFDEIVYEDVRTPLGSQTTTLNVVCWKNKGVIDSVTDDSYISSTGSCEYDSEEGIIEVTGNCTITLYAPGTL